MCKTKILVMSYILLLYLCDYKFDFSYIMVPFKEYSFM